MPPYSYPTFEEIEAKEWASNTVSNILSDISPVSFESDFSHSKRPQLEIETSSPVDNKGYHGNNGHLRRSFSFLEGSLLSNLPSQQEQQQQQQQQKESRNSRRSQSTILPSTHIISDASKSAMTRSAPTTPTNKLSPQPSFSSRIRHTWHMDRASVKQLFNTSDIHDNHKKSSKEQKGITIWRNTCQEYMLHPPPSLQIETKVPTKRSMQLSKFIMGELLSTEETYLSHLLTIKNFYMDPLLQAAKSQKSLVNLKDIETIFAFIPQLIILSTALVEQLHDTITPYLDDDSQLNQVAVGKAFCNLEPYFDIYIAYAVNFSKSRKYLSKASSNIVYRQLVQDTMRKKETNRMVLSDYMIAPIQRITRYCLLLTDLQKHSNRSHPDYVYLAKSLKTLSALAFAMDTIQQ
ncbi:Dbl homology domain-containing protein [Mucor lusitanicus]|uniref:DH domain-containing protein n=2 Tax=Mucor circinelloides f. lusitanicus TaxID=29924 RepID=A0A168IN82_MUCCL|nr:Dbl homology domain-containing protein [Mucor lusitanicus]OAD00143.1 hypothetical protein MUCCIDRAFT_165949 [Mucor lusitanicus CBS 277.49]